MLSRRRFNLCLAAGLAAAALPQRVNPAPSRRSLRVAAIQMTPRLGDVAANLEQAETLILEAQRKGAEWIVLPEYFTSAAAFHPDMLSAIRPLDGEPAVFLQRLARRGNCAIGGSFLAHRDRDVYNSFLLAFPDGSLQRHDKDYPSLWENCVCRGGEDEGVLTTPIGEVGAALCWELIRARTAERLLGKVQMVIGGSCWWTLPDEADLDHPMRVTNLRMLREAPVRFARMLGVPVIHGSLAGPFSGFLSPDLPDVPYDSHYLGEAMVVDDQGHVLARRGMEQGAGVVLADIELPAPARSSEPIPQRFWIPEEMPASWKVSWIRWLDRGAHYYQTVTQPFLETGQINEYVPRYLQ